MKKNEMAKEEKKRRNINESSLEIRRNEEEITMKI
jgi:hypothetical protein